MSRRCRLAVESAGILPYGVVFLLLVLGLAGRPTRAAPQASDVGFVVSVEGDWVVAGTEERLIVGATVSGGARIRAVNRADPNAHIRVALLDERVLALSCKTAGACASDLLVPESLGEPSPLGKRLLEAVKRLRREPHRYVPIASRGSSLPREAVVPIVSQGLDLEGIIAPASATAQLSIRPLREAMGDATAIPLTVHSGSTIGVPPTGKSIAPGLYELGPMVFQDDASDGPWIDGAWVLAVPPDRHAALADNLHHASRLLSDPQGGTMGTARPILRAYLLLLSETLEAERGPER